MQTNFTQERLAEISAGYDLDCGGYGFDPIDLPGVDGALQWDDPDPDYVPWITGDESPRAFHELAGMSTVYVFVPFDYSVDFPPVGWVDSDGDCWVLIRHGILYDTDRDCHCEDQHRQATEYGETTCGRPGCIDGTIESPYGSWALYAFGDGPVDKILRGYADCALWSETDQSDDSGGNPLDDNYGRGDIEPDSIRTMRADCETFYRANEADCDSADYPPTREYLDDYERIGHDLWLTRNGHGTGFWDRDLGDVGDRLSRAAESLGSCHLEVGDNGRLDYFAG